MGPRSEAHPASARRAGRRLLPAPMLALLLTAQLSPAHATPDIDAGRRTFQQVCAQCHQIGPSARAGYGPELNGIIGRPSASTDYHYSAAMRNAHIVWTADKLRAFLHGPDDLVPGTKMSLSGFWTSRDLDNLIGYLRTVKANGLSSQ